MNYDGDAVEPSGKNNGECSGPAFGKNGVGHVQKKLPERLRHADKKFRDIEDIEE